MSPQGGSRSVYRNGYQNPTVQRWGKGDTISEISGTGSKSAHLFSSELLLKNQVNNRLQDLNTLWPTLQSIFAITNSVKSVLNMSKYDHTAKKTSISTQKYNHFSIPLSGWPLVGNEGMNPHHIISMYDSEIPFPHSLLRAIQLLFFHRFQAITLHGMRKHLPL